MRTSLATLSLLLASCGGGGGTPLDPDAAAPDAAPPDAAPPDAEVPDAIPPDALPPCEECPVGYVIDSLAVPVTAAQAEQLGFDLDGDGTVDNQIGNIFAALEAANGELSLQAANTRAIDRGEIVLLAAFEACEPGLCLFTYHGSDPAPAPCLDAADPICRRHLAGDGQFTIDPPTDRFLPGTLAGGAFSGGPGQMVLALSMGVPARLELIEAHAELTGVSDTGIAGGKLGGAVPDAFVQTELIPAMHAWITALIAADCTGGVPPGCGCADGSTGETLLGIFDEDADCAVGLEEFRANSLIETLLRPDVDTDGDGTEDALSVGVGVSAVGATFTP